MPIKPRRIAITAMAVLIATLPIGCATKKYVRAEVDETETRTQGRIDDVSTAVERTQDRLAEHDSEIAAASETARQALDRAIAAGKLAEGKFLYERVLTDDQVRFEFDKASLSTDANAALAAFAAELKSRNENVYVEIQGHTDATGTDEYNLKLGENRAEAVKRHLNMQHGLAMHRMAAISYGESAPIGNNSARDGRAANRRVTLVVLK